ncbi:MAG: hypothetical protein HQL47_10695 [Gammaproteobacteria bacterium]|nr:hypothetical protein [Gammaproteobacteria bacterium]
MKLETDCQVIFFTSSSGHCTFDCDYCIINPIAKHQPSLTFEDLKFLIDSFGVKAFFSFSGVGDFFVSYSRSQRLLSRLLEENVEIALDTNGAVLQDFPDLTQAQLEKIRYINLTMHYHQIKRKNLLQRWPEHARIFIDNRREQIYPDYILSPALRDEWPEALAYYAEQVFKPTGKPLLLVRDINQVFDPQAEARIAQLQRDFADILQPEAHQENFAAGFADRPQVLCPAGKGYFRVWNDGRIQGCPNLVDVPELLDCGNAKERRLEIRPQPFLCNSPRYCDCNVIDALGKMQLPKPPGFFQRLFNPG